MDLFETDLLAHTPGPWQLPAMAAAEEGVRTVLFEVAKSADGVDMRMVPADHLLDDDEDEDDEDDEGGHSGLFVGVFLDPTAASLLAVDGGEDPDELHVTLCYIADPEDEDILAAVDAIATVARGQRMLSGTVAGQGCWDTPDGRCSWAAVDVRGLDALRADVVDTLRGGGVAVDETHGWTPHITRVYLDDGEPEPVAPSAVPLMFDSISIGIGDTLVTIPFGASLTKAQVVDVLDEVAKANPNHDARGRFASRGGGGGSAASGRRADSSGFLNGGYGPDGPEDDDDEPPMPKPKKRSVSEGFLNGGYGPDDYPDDDDDEPAPPRVKKAVHGVEVVKFNRYHGADGRFSSGPGGRISLGAGTGGTVRGAPGTLPRGGLFGVDALALDPTQRRARRRQYRAGKKHKRQMATVHGRDPQTGQRTSILRRLRDRLKGPADEGDFVDISDFGDQAMSSSARFRKAAEDDLDNVFKNATKRFTLAPWYVPDRLDAHEEWSTADELQKALWGYVRKGQRDIMLQHRPGFVAGELVEAMQWPYPVTLPMHKADGTIEDVEYPAGTVFAGTVWKDWAFELVKEGRITGLSIGGRAIRIPGGPDGSVEKAEKWDESKVTRSDDGEFASEGSSSANAAEETARRNAGPADLSFMNGPDGTYDPKWAKRLLDEDPGRAKKLKPSQRAKLVDVDPSLYSHVRGHVDLNAVGAKAVAEVFDDYPEDADLLDDQHARAVFNTRKPNLWSKPMILALYGDGEKRIPFAEAQKLEKANPYHDAMGRFAAGPGGGMAAVMPGGGTAASNHAPPAATAASPHAEHRGAVVAEGGPFTADHPRVQAAAAASVADAQRMEIDTTPLVVGIAAKVGGEPVGLAHRFKTQGSTARKIAEDTKNDGISPEEAGLGMSDGVRYTIQVSQGNYGRQSKGVIAELEAAGYEPRVKNFWATGDPYNGINIKARHPGTGREFELQIHTKTSFAVKEEAHLSYDEYRLPTTSTSRKQELWLKMVGISDKQPFPLGFDAVQPLRVQPGNPFPKGTLHNP